MAGDAGTAERFVFPTVDFRTGRVRIIDQTLLPAEERIVELATVEEVADAIRALKVRGAPAIGLAAAYGVLLALETHLRDAVVDPPDYIFDRLAGARPFVAAPVTADDVRSTCAAARALLATTRPTAVNLFWALDRMGSVLGGETDDVRVLCNGIAREAFAIHREELEIEYAIGRHGSRLVTDGMTLLTHCNAGGLATAGYGTALGVITYAHEQGKRLTVFADETRPLLQGTRLTAWELARRGIDVTVLCDNAAASLFAASRIDAVIVGADRIAANGDTANKIGTLNLALLCKEYRRPFYVAAPISTFDPATASGDQIPIEERPGTEVTTFAGARIAPAGVAAYNPAFDVTPASCITAIVTERGIVERPDSSTVQKFLGDDRRRSPDRTGR